MHTYIKGKLNNLHITYKTEELTTTRRMELE